MFLSPFSQASEVGLGGMHKLSFPPMTDIASTAHACGSWNGETNTGSRLFSLVVNKSKWGGLPELKNLRQGALVKGPLCVNYLPFPGEAVGQNVQLPRYKPCR